MAGKGDNLLSDWLRDDTEGRAEDIENVDKEATEDETVELEGDKERVTVVGERHCCDFPSS